MKHREAHTPGYAESDIQGNGYGASHNWKNRGTRLRATEYICASCGAHFRHHYNQTPSIFKAMALAGIPDQCSIAKATGGSNE